LEATKGIRQSAVDSGKHSFGHRKVRAPSGWKKVDLRLYRLFELPPMCAVAQHLRSKLRSSKIEKPGPGKISNHLDEADGVMVARGDLG
jgi:hypothetical protein